MQENMSDEVLISLIGKDRLHIFHNIDEYILNIYDMEKTWNTGGKKWDWECKYRKGSKTLCAFYLKKDCLGFMIIFGKAEREKIESSQNMFSKELIELYDSTTTYHDGKWLMIELENLFFFEDIKNLLQVKRKPNKK